MPKTSKTDKKIIIFLLLLLLSAVDLTGMRDQSRRRVYHSDRTLQTSLRDFRVSYGHTRGPRAQEIFEARPIRVTLVPPTVKDPKKCPTVASENKSDPEMPLVVCATPDKLEAVMDFPAGKDGCDATEEVFSKNTNSQHSTCCQHSTSPVMNTDAEHGRESPSSSASSVADATHQSLYDPKTPKRKRKPKLTEITNSEEAVKPRNRAIKTARKVTHYGCARNSRVNIDRALLSEKHLDWVEPCYVPPPDVSEDEDFITDGPTPKKRKKFKDPYVVDKILGMMVDPAGDDLYFIRWLGYDDRTWEPFQNLDNCPGKLKEFRKDMQVMPKYEQMRQRFFVDMEKFREKINKPWPDQDSGIEVVNNVDFTAPMMTFNYIIQLKLPLNRDMVEVGCECEDGICDKSCSCANMDGLKVPYKEDGTVNRKENHPIYECNQSCACSCNPDVCPFRVVQRGRTVKLQIFKTDNGRGWGVKALEHIKKNQFVVEYVGEVISYEEADSRGKLYDARGRTYLFDMDLFEDESTSQNFEKFTIDAKPYGNEARFINHACTPNLMSRAVWWESFDPSIHHLALFARRDIKVGEELTFSYNNSSCSKQNTYAATKNEGQVQCQCKKNCPNKLFK